MPDTLEGLEQLPWLAAAERVRPLSNSAVATSWLLETGAERLVLRRDGARAASLGLDRRREFHMMRTAFGAGLAPEPLHWDGALGTLLRRHVDGETWAAQVDDVAERPWPALGALLRRVHALAPPRVKPLDIGASAQRYADVTGAAGDVALARDIGNRAAALTAGEAPVCCHHDAHLENVIGPIGDANHACLIDWEYAAPGHPLFDLAVVAGYHGLAGPELDALLAGWAGNDAPCDTARLPAFIGLYHDLAGLWERAIAAPACGMPPENRARIMWVPVNTRNRS